MTTAVPQPFLGLRRPPTAFAWTACISIIALMAFLRLRVMPDAVLPIAYGVPLVLNLWFRDRRCLWVMALGFAAIVVAKYTVFMHQGAFASEFDRHIAMAIILLDTGVIAIVIDAFIASRASLERSLVDLRLANDDLAAREEEIARQNEELQSQTEELERQSEELRVSNEELARRERTLQALLTLSRTLSAEQTQGEALSRVCDAMRELLDDEDSGIAVWEREGDELVVKCGRGIASHPDAHRIPLNQSFASLVLSREHTGYLEDVSLRSDLKLIPPAEGAPFRSVLATPLRRGNESIGTIEIYGREQRSWSEEQIAVIESLSAQLSVTLAAVGLMRRIEADRQRLQTVLQTLPMGVLISDDPEGRQMRGNAALASMYHAESSANFSPLAPHASLIRRSFHRDGRPIPMDDLPLVRAMRTGQAVLADEFQVSLSDSRTIYILMSAAPFFDEHGRVTGGVGALMDITIQKQLQRELDVRRREAEEASVRKTRFLAAVSHDIRTPANAISLLSELLRRASANPAMMPEIPALAQELHGSATSLVNLLSDVLDVARFDSGKIEIQETEFPLSDLLEEEQRRLMPLARDKQLQLRMTVQTNGLRVRGDRIKLGRIIDNLVGNAIKFTATGEVRVESELREDGCVCIRVVDTGIGIHFKDQSHIFDEFFQLSNPERDRTKGTGLGLTICKRLADAMGGDLHVHSEPGQGSTFTLTLPASATVSIN